MANRSQRMLALVLGLGMAGSALSGAAYPMGGGGDGGGDGGKSGVDAAGTKTAPAPAATAPSGSGKPPVAQPVADPKKTVTPGPTAPSD